MEEKQGLPTLRRYAAMETPVNKFDSPEKTLFLIIQAEAFYFHFL